METINKVFDNTASYVLSSEYYSGAPTSKLEDMVQRYENDKVIRPHELVEMYEEAKTWDPLSSIYLLPILFVLTKYVLYRPLAPWMRR